MKLYNNNDNCYPTMTPIVIVMEFIYLRICQNCLQFNHVAGIFFYQHNFNPELIDKLHNFRYVTNKITRARSLHTPRRIQMSKLRNYKI